jgi:hypothetical protein
MSDPKRQGRKSGIIKSKQIQFPRPRKPKCVKRGFEFYQKLWG